MWIFDGAYLVLSQTYVKSRRPTESLSQDSGRLRPIAAPRCCQVKTFTLVGGTNLDLSARTICTRAWLSNKYNQRVRPHWSGKCELNTNSLVALAVLQPKRSPEQLEAFHHQVRRKRSHACKVVFSSDPLGPKVTWMVMLLDFASRFPDLPEWQVNRNLHKCACQFSSRLKRLTVLKGIKVHPFKHASTLTAFNFGRLSGFCGLFNPSSPFRVWFLLVNASLALYADTRKNSIELDLEHIRWCPVPLQYQTLRDPRTRDVLLCFTEISRGPSSVLRKKRGNFLPRPTRVVSFPHGNRRTALRPLGGAHKVWPCPEQASTVTSASRCPRTKTCVMARHKCHG